MREVSCAILAGGKSSRLGNDKALLEIDGVPLIQRIALRLGRISDDVMAVGTELSRLRFLKVRLIEDLIVGAGALGGIYSALKAAKHEHVFVVACDMPFVDMNLVRYLVLLSEGYDVVMPYIGGEAEPLHAVYGKTCLLAIEDAIRAGKRRIISFLPRVKVRDVREDEIQVLDPEFRSFFNVNTPEDLARMKQFLSQGRGKQV